jgi:hypothetical protein
MKDKPGKLFLFGNFERRGGKKLSQQGVEFSRKAREVRRHSTGGFHTRKG